MIVTDHFFQKRVQPPPPGKTRFTHTDGWADGRTDIQTDGDYTKRVVHGPPGDHTLKNIRVHAKPTSILVVQQVHLGWENWVNFKFLMAFRCESKIRGVLNIYLPTATNMISTERLHSHFESVNGDPCGTTTILLRITDRAEHAGK